MTAALRDTAAYASTVERLGYIRFLPAAHAEGQTHVEWFHFVVHARDVDVIVNLSLVATGRDAPSGHVVVLARRADGKGWEGDVRRVPAEEVRCRAGRMRMQLADATVEFDDVFRVRASCGPTSVDLILEPRSFACLAHDLSANGAGFQWVVAPRLAASGTVDGNGDSIRIEAAPAYHDHNWGQLEDGSLSWDWACSVSQSEEEPWNVVLVRMLDRTRTHARVEGLLVWQGPHRRRGFRNESIRVTPEGLLRPAVLTRVPRGLSLLSPGNATDVPQRLRIQAECDGDHLSGEITCSDVARILVPHEHDLGLTAIHEVAGRVRLAGRIGGRAVEIDAPAFCEFAGRAP